MNTSSGRGGNRLRLSREEQVHTRLLLPLAKPQGLLGLVINLIGSGHSYCMRTPRRAKARITALPIRLLKRAWEWTHTRAGQQNNCWKRFDTLELIRVRLWWGKWSNFRCYKYTLSHVCGRIWSFKGAHFLKWEIGLNILLPIILLAGDLYLLGYSLHRKDNSVSCIRMKSIICNSYGNVNALIWTWENHISLHSNALHCKNKMFYAF